MLTTALFPLTSQQLVRSASRSTSKLAHVHIPEHPLYCVQQCKHSRARKLPAMNTIFSCIKAQNYHLKSQANVKYNHLVDSPHLMLVATPLQTDHF